MSIKKAVGEWGSVVVVTTFQAGTYTVTSIVNGIEGKPNVGLERAEADELSNSLFDSLVIELQDLWEVRAVTSLELGEYVMARTNLQLSFICDHLDYVVSIVNKEPSVDHSIRMVQALDEFSSLWSVKLTSDALACKAPQDYTDSGYAQYQFESSLEK